MNVAQNGGGGGGLIPILMIGLLFVAMYFLMIRPQKRHRQQQQEMQRKLSVGDQVVTIGGLYGTVAQLDDESAILEVAPGVTNRYARSAIARIVESTSGEGAEESAGGGTE